MELVVLVIVSLALAVAASMERTAAAMSQCAARIRDSRSDVNDFDDSFTWLIVASNRSGDGATATVTSDSNFISFLDSAFQNMNATDFWKQVSIF